MCTQVATYNARYIQRNSRNTNCQSKVTKVRKSLFKAIEAELSLNSTETKDRRVVWDVLKIFLLW